MRLTEKIINAFKKVNLEDAIMIPTIIGFIYGILAAIWTFNPTIVPNLNLKIVLTGLFIVALVVLRRIIIAKSGNKE